MNNKFLETKELILEPLESKHLTTEYTAWLNDKDTTKYNSHGIYPNTYIKTKEYINSTQSSKTEIALAIIQKKSLKHIGNISISSIDFINSNADIGIVIGNKNSNSKGYATQAFNAIILHCFNKLNLHKVTAGTTSDNIAMQKILENLNMEKEAILKEQIQRDNVFVDIYKYGLINKN